MLHMHTVWTTRTRDVTCEVGSSRFRRLLPVSDTGAQPVKDFG